MNRLFTFIAAIMLAGNVLAQSGYCTKASDANGKSTFQWSNTQNFCPIIVSSEVLQTMRDNGGIKLDMQVDNKTSHLYIWESTYTAKPANDVNSFGSTGGYLDYAVSKGKSWSGMGFINSAGLDMSFLTDNYYLHFGTRGKVATHLVTLGGAEFSIGQGSMDGKKNLGCWVDDGEWYYFDIPVTMLKSLGKLFNNNSASYKDNYLTALSGGTAGTELILENVFLYEKKDNGKDDGDDEKTGNLVDFTPEKSYTPAKSFKRGISEENFTTSAQMQALEPGISWHYNWGTSPKACIADICGPGKPVEFVPMAWNASGINAVKTYLANNPGVRYVLGFNEPNFRSQANMTPSAAARQWKNLEAIAEEYGVELVAPALNYSGEAISDGIIYSPEQWMDAFIAAYKAENGGKEPRMDYLALHSYMNDHSAMIGFVEGFARKYERKVWLTEFCAWEGTVTEQQQRKSMSQKLDDLEQSPYVYRYAWFKATGSNAAPYFRLLNGNALTDMGKMYVGHSSFETAKYYVPGEQIKAKDYVAANNISLAFNTDSDSHAAPVQVTNFDFGTSLTYQIDVPTADTYTLALRMSDRAYLKPLQVGVYLDGTDTPVATQQLSVTGKTDNTDKWATEGFDLALPAGKHTMQLRSLQSTDCSLQWLSFFKKETGGIVSATSSASDVSSVRYYNMQGAALSVPAHGVVIRKTARTDGSVSVEKIVIK